MDLIVWNKHRADYLRRQMSAIILIVNIEE